MRVFIEVVKLNLKYFLQRKWAFLLTLIADPVILLINIALFTSIYRYNKTQSILGYSLTQMIWYFTVIQFVWYFVWNQADVRIAERILSGDLAVDLLRPLSVFRFELGNAVALRIMGVTLEFIPNMLLCSLVIHPDFLTLFSLLKFFAVVIMAFILFFLTNYLIGLLAFLIKNNSSIRNIKFIIISLAAGAYIPLEFFPGWFNRIMDFFPFKYLFYWPVQFFLNREFVRGFRPFVEILSIQALWAAGLYILCRLSWRQTMKRFCAVGG